MFMLPWPPPIFQNYLFKRDLDESAFPEKGCYFYTYSMISKVLTLFVFVPVKLLVLFIEFEMFFITDGYIYAVFTSRNSLTDVSLQDYFE